MQLDQDRSGRLDFGEIHRAIHLSGHNVDFLQLSKLLHKLDRQKNNSLAFDGYIELCLFLRTVREVFKKYDVAQQQRVTLGYE